MIQQGLVQQCRLIVVAGMVAAVMFAFVGSFAIPGQQLKPITAIIPIVVAAGAFLGCEVIGFRGVIADSAHRDKNSTMASARTAFRTTTLLRFALAETPALIGFALAFSGQPPSRLPAWIGAGLAFALLGLVAYPGRRQIAKLQSNLERNGLPSYLSEALSVQSTDDFGSSQSGPIQEAS